MTDLTEDLRAALADRYRLEKEIGRGGMAVVYLAHDLRHDRRVAIKVLLPELASAVTAERFLQEIRLTANFSHPHILPLLDSGKVAGLVYYVMPYVEGETLRDRLEREGQLPVKDAVRIGGEVAGALDYAHEQGVLHRDVKPENILLQAGHAVVADFGIARAVKEAAGERLTDTGVKIGTPAYMSPEQAAGDEVDARSDIYSLACVLYEMLGGEAPFAGASSVVMLARKVSGELLPINEVRPEVDRELEAVLNRGLSAPPEERFATTGEFAEALERAGAPAGPTIGLGRALGMYAAMSVAVLVVVNLLLRWLDIPSWLMPGAVAALLVGLPVVMATALVQRAPAPGVRGLTPGRAAARRWLTWRRASLAVVGAFAVLGVAVSGYSGMRLMGVGPMGTLFARGALQEHDRIVLAEFVDQASDPELAMAVTTAFRIDLEQSYAVDVADRDFVVRVLERMEINPDTPLDYELARQIAIREGLKAVISGEVTAVGTGYLISARLTVAESGEQLWAGREQARDADAVIDATEGLSRKLRAQIGESLADVRASPPLAQVTTASLEALKKYSQATREQLVPGRVERIIRPLEEAIALDSTFAAAWWKLGWAQELNHDPKSVFVHSFTRAWELRDGVSERERYNIEYFYHTRITEDETRTLALLEDDLEQDPDRIYCHNDLGFNYLDLHRYEEAEPLLRRCLELDSLNSTIPYYGLAQVQAALGKWDAADTTVRRASELFGQEEFVIFRIALQSARGNYDAADAELRAWKETPGLSRQSWLLSRFWGSRLAQVRGRLAEADRNIAEVRRDHEERGTAAERLRSASDQAVHELRWRGDTARALLILEEALDRWPLDSMPLLDRPYLELANGYARAGKTERARTYLADYVQTHESETRLFRRNRYEALGNIALAEGRYQDAIEEYRLAHPLATCQGCVYPSIAWAYDQAGQPDSAIAFYERYLNTPGLFKAFTLDAHWLGVIYERLGHLYERRRDTDRSVYYFGKLIDLWEDADAELQPRVEAARRAVRSQSPDT